MADDKVLADLAGQNVNAQATAPAPSKDTPLLVVPEAPAAPVASGTTRMVIDEIFDLIETATMADALEHAAAVRVHAFVDRYIDRLAAKLKARLAVMKPKQ